MQVKILSNVYLNPAKKLAIGSVVNVTQSLGNILIDKGLAEEVATETPVVRRRKAKPDGESE
jgi:hypothetical protein